MRGVRRVAVTAAFDTPFSRPADGHLLSRRRAPVSPWLHSRALITAQAPDTQYTPCAFTARVPIPATEAAHTLATLTAATGRTRRNGDQAVTTP